MVRRFHTGAYRHTLILEESSDLIKKGISGSPIVVNDGTAIGIVCLNDDNLALVGDLPGWLLRKSY
jgi:predicted transcriptional regulator